MKLNFIFKNLIYFGKLITSPSPVFFTFFTFTFFVSLLVSFFVSFFVSLLVSFFVSFFVSFG